MCRPAGGEAGSVVDRSRLTAAGRGERVGRSQRNAGAKSPPRAGLTGSRVTGVADQALNSAQNFLLLVVVARNTDPTSLGAFSVALSVAVLVVGLGRALIGEAALISLSTDPHESRSFIGAALILSAALGVASAAVLLVAGFTLPNMLASLFRTLAVLTPVLLVQDTCRYLLTGSGRTGGALMVDIAWVAAWAGGIFATPRADAQDHLTLWAGTAFVGGLLGILLLKPHFRLRDLQNASRRLSGLSKALLLEWALLAANQQVLIFALAGIAGLPATGGLRAAQSLYGPITTLINAVRLVFVREMARTSVDAKARAARLAVNVSAGSALIAAVFTVFTLLLPGRLGAELYGSTWPVAKPLLLPIGLQVVVAAGAVGAFTYLRGAGLVKRSVLAATVGTTVASLLAVTGATVRMELAAYGLLIGTLVTTVLTWLPALRAFRPAASARGQLGAVTSGREIGPPNNRPVRPNETCGADGGHVERNPKRDRSGPRHRRT